MSGALAGAVFEALAFIGTAIGAAFVARLPSEAAVAHALGRVGLILAGDADAVGPTARSATPRECAAGVAGVFDDARGEVGPRSCEIGEDNRVPDDCHTLD